MIRSTLRHNPHLQGFRTDLALFCRTLTNMRWPARCYLCGLMMALVAITAMAMPRGTGSHCEPCPPPPPFVQTVSDSISGHDGAFVQSVSDPYPVTMDVADDEECFVHGLPGCSVHIWEHLGELGYPSDCGQNDCGDCIPPNSKSEEKNEQHQLWFVDTYSNGKERRQSAIRSLLDGNGLKSGHDEDPVILTVFNYGFAHLFLNWVCGLHRNDLVHLKRNSLIVVADAEAKALAIKSGFEMVIDLHDVADVDKLGITSSASMGFGAGSHQKIVSFQMMILSDLIEMGYDTVMMDIDVVFPNDPLQYVRNELNPAIDVWMMLDPRWDGAGPANTGFISMRSNCKTKKFMAEIMNHILVIHTLSDQRTINFFLHWKPFRQIQFRLLDRELFIDGAKLVLLKKEPKDFPQFEKVVVVHASWTGDHLNKLIKFNQIGHYYFTEDRCPEHYDLTFVPDLTDRNVPSDLSDRSNTKEWVQTSTYLVTHRFVTDKKALLKETEELQAAAE